MIAAVQTPKGAALCEHRAPFNRGQPQNGVLVPSEQGSAIELGPDDSDIHRCPFLITWGWPGDAPGPRVVWVVCAYEPHTSSQVL